MKSMRGVNGSVSGVDIYILIFFKFGGLHYGRGQNLKPGGTPLCACASHARVGFGIPLMR